MESFDLTYKLIALNIKSKSTLCLKYFRNIVIVMTKGKNKKMKTTKIYLFLLPPLPSQDGGVVALQPPQPPNFFYGKNFSKNAKTARGKIRKGGATTPPPEREG